MTLRQSGSDTRFEDDACAWGEYMSDEDDESEEAVGLDELDREIPSDDVQTVRKRGFLEFSIEYLQGRLNFVNDKANVFIAIQTGLFVGIVWLLGTFFLPPVQQGLAVETIAVLGFLLVNFAFVIGITALLLQTIRPSGTYLSLFTEIDTIDTTGVMWPGGDVPEAPAFVDEVESMSADDMDEELVGTVYVLQQLVDRTYTSYRWAVLLMKIQVFVVPLGFLALAFYTYLR